MTLDLSIDDRVLALICLHVEMGHGVPRNDAITKALDLPGYTVAGAVSRLKQIGMIDGIGKDGRIQRLTTRGWQWSRSNPHLLTLAGMGELKVTA